MSDSGHDWGLGDIAPLAGIIIQGWPPERAEAEFLKRFNLLWGRM